MQRFDLWRETPRKSIVVVLVSVFLFFTTIGFCNDIIAMGRESPIRLCLEVVLSGLFAIAYAIAGVSLKKRWWIGVPPIFAVQYFVMYQVALRLPDWPTPAVVSVSELGAMRARLTFDSIATMVAVTLGYIGFFNVGVRQARRYAQTRTENALFESEMAAARQVQQVILPDPHQSFPGFAVQSVYKPARDVGGDFFQILPGKEGGLLFVIGDVSGKGLPAAMLVSLLVGAIRATAEDTHDPALLLSKLHDRIAGHTADGFATALAAFIAGDGLVTLSNAGHLSPYIDGKEVALPGALPLGISGAGQYEAVKTCLPSGSRLTFLSDGVVEAQNPRGELFGFEKAMALSQEPAATIAEAAVRFGQADDITVVTIERRATSL